MDIGGPELRQAPGSTSTTRRQRNGAWRLPLGEMAVVQWAAWRWGGAADNIGGSVEVPRIAFGHWFEVLMASVPGWALERQAPAIGRAKRQTDWTERLLERPIYWHLHIYDTACSSPSPLTTKLKEPPGHSINIS